MSPESTRPTFEATPRPRRTRTYWTKDEDRILISAVETFSGSPSQWSEVAKRLCGRSPKDCRKRWANGLNTSLKKGPWTADEDTKLRRAVLIHKYDWASISKLVGHRSGDQCSKRWREVVDPSINKQPWTPEEDDLLLRLYNKHGSAWQEIKEHFSNRRGLQCRNRCCHLLGTRSKKKRTMRASESPDDEPSRPSLTTQNLQECFPLPSNYVPSPPSSQSSSSPVPPTPSPLLVDLPSPSLGPSHMRASFPVDGFSVADNIGKMIEPTPVLSSSPCSIYTHSPTEWYHSPKQEFSNSTLLKPQSPRTRLSGSFGDMDGAFDTMPSSWLTNPAANSLKPTHAELPMFADKFHTAIIGSGAYDLPVTDTASFGIQTPPPPHDLLSLSTSGPSSMVNENSSEALLYPLLRQTMPGGDLPFLSSSSHCPPDLGPPGFPHPRRLGDPHVFQTVYGDSSLSPSLYLA
ncbi:hypothetical protein K435DRAFT_857365 [Dendrothele bispora CBS 962.96]|uniref:Homeodomain-like protein n=1 Tax=Dendrothele bispora (strain CBS 962.96) TaxID=1314807 RepID=A0A4S8M606_DENBC|nr:hypothetical protein K435DRAFT_857365 [Dendrothele bispora CBS 962.96]